MSFKCFLFLDVCIVPLGLLAQGSSHCDSTWRTGTATNHGFNGNVLNCIRKYWLDAVYCTD